MADIEYTPAPMVGQFINDYLANELFYSFIVGPFGCLAEDTLVITEFGPMPIADIDRPMRVLSWNEKTCRFQLSWCGGSFPKGRDYLYRVTTPQGEFDAAGQHLLLCADGVYRRVEDLHRGDALASYSQNQHPTTEELSQSESPEDAPHCSQTDVDSLERYAASARRYGQLFRQEEDIYRGAAPQPTDAPVSTGCSVQSVFSRKDGLLALSLGHIRSELFADHLRTDGYVNRVVRRGPDEAYRSTPSICARIAQIGLQVQRSLRKIARRLKGQKSFSRSRSYSLSPSERAILSIARQDVKRSFWDLQVIDTNNYVTADGAIHHNSAKTTGSLMKIPHMAQLQAPSLLDGIRRTRCVVVRNTLPQLNDTTLKSWNIWFKDGVAGKWLATQKTFILRFGDVECEVLFRALDTADDVSKVLSLEVTFAVLDEFVQINTEIREGLSGRCGRYPPKIEGGATNFGMWGASNPGEEDTDWHNFLIENKPKNVSYFHQPSGLSPDAENLENLPPGYYTNLAQGKSPSWIKQFIEAEWGFSVAGKPVVPTFNRDLHVAKTNLIPNPHTPLVIGYDPGMHSALLICQDDSYGRLLVLDELILEGYGAQRMCTDRLIPLLNQKYRGYEVVIAPDPACQSRTQTNETSVLDILKEQRFKKYWSIKVGPTNLIAPRLEAIEHFTTRLTEKGPALLIDPRCRKIIKALSSGWRYEKTKGGNEKETPEKNEWSHPGDSLTYAAQYFQTNTSRAAKRKQSNVTPLRTFPNQYNMR